MESPREIKYRALDEINHRMRQVSELNLNNGCAWCPTDTLPICLHGGLFKLMQYTGLLDKQGREIYEGDIVYAGVWGIIGYYDKDNFIIEFSRGVFRGFRVKYFKKKDRFRFSAPLYKLETVEVIGNIYETPELLEVKE